MTPEYRLPVDAFKVNQIVDDDGKSGWWIMEDGIKKSLTPVTAFSSEDPWLFEGQRGSLYSRFGRLNETLEVQLVANGVVPGIEIE